MKQFLSLALLCATGILVHASDKNAYEGTIALGKFVAKKYVLNNYTSDNASSKTCFALVDSKSTNENKVIVYNRKASYNKCAEKTIPTSRVKSAITIINDTHIVTGQKYNDGLYVTPIFWEEAAKNIKLPAYTSPSGIDTNYINELRAMKNNDMHFLCTTSSAGVFVLDFSTEKVVDNFDILGSYILPALPNASGDGIWYISSTHSNSSVQYRLGHYDLRSAKTTTNIELPKNVNSLSFSVNPSGTRCAFASKNDRVHIFDITAQKTDQTLFVPEECQVSDTMFIDDETLIYNTKKPENALSNTDHQLHSFSISSGDRARCALPHHNRFHKNTGLVIGYRYLMSLTIYDFDFKQ